jgi:hypothetical protein
MSDNPFKKMFLLLLLIFLINRLHAMGETSGIKNSLDSISKELVITNDTVDGFCITNSGKSVPLLISSTDYPGVIKALRDLQHDIDAVTNAEPRLFMDTIPSARKILIVGTFGSPIIDKLINSRLLNTDIKGKWETYRIQVVKNPFPGVEEALVIAGSDKRGTIYGIYELSKKMGVSPWYWWADVKPGHRDIICLKKGIYSDGPPSVKYRGIFLNDEAPDLTNWIYAKFGTVTPGDHPPIPNGVANYNHEFYSRVFELILRLKGNYLWPAMWNNAFNEDDSLNARMADEYGIVMGTSHQEPMIRAQKEWDRRFKSTLGSWNYVKHGDTLRQFWREGIRRNKSYESIITLGLRGADDTEMAPGGPDANRSLLEEIVNVQRGIIADEINIDVTRVPQMWCLYKEVLDYYKAGMRVPDDVTLLWAEDNWGNIRRLPTKDEQNRSGGAGIYYHFDYHGGPRSYQWINSNPIPKIWDQMSLARQYGAERIWIVNAGHLKGYEFPMEFFMNLAWYKDSLTHSNLQEYTRMWTVAQFGEANSEEIAGIMSKYTQYNGRRKPELLAPDTYSLINYREAENIVSDYNLLAKRAENIYTQLPEIKRDAFYQLVLFPVKASALVNELYVIAGKNELYYNQGRVSTNDMALKTRLLFQEDTSLMGYFNNKFADGRWQHFMDQPHLGYTGWRDPPYNSLEAIDLKQIKPSDEPLMGVSIEGSEKTWPDASDKAILPEFDVYNRQSYFIEIFNRGKSKFTFRVSTRNKWLIISELQGVVSPDKRIWISIDWDKAPKGKINGMLKITGASREVQVNITVNNPMQPSAEQLDGFVESNGCVSMEAEHFTGKTDGAKQSRWERIEDYGHTLSGMRTYTNAYDSVVPGINSACLEYRMYLFTSGDIEVNPVFAPSLNFMPDRDVRYAISIDDEKPQIITLLSRDYDAKNGNSDWEQTVSDNFRRGSSHHSISMPGYHILNIWMVDPGLVLQKVVVNTGGVKSSYLGPPESFYRRK